MGYLKLLLLFLGLNLIFPSVSFSQKRMTPEDLVAWKRIIDKKISNDGQWIGYKLAPWDGDATVKLIKSSGEEIASYTPAKDLSFSASSDYFLITKTPSKTEIDSLKIKKTKKDQMPMNSLIIRHVSGKEEVIDSLKSLEVAENVDWIAYRRTRKDSTLYIKSLDGTTEFKYPSVSEFRFAKKSSQLFYVSKGDSISAKAGLYSLNPEKRISSLIKEGKGIFKHVTFDETGQKLAFLYCEEKDSVYKNMEVWLSENNNPARTIATKETNILPTGWVISEHGNVHFSENSNRLFFGIAPKPMQKDSTILAENRSLVEVWNWNEHTQYTVQHKEKTNDLKKSYKVAYNLDTNKLIQLNTENIPDVILGDKGNAEFAVLFTSLPYPTSEMWEGRQYKDYYVISLETGKIQPLKKKISDRIHISPQGKYAWWYASRDSSWYTFSFEQLQEYRITTPQTFTAWNEDNDVPDFPTPHGSAGWTTDDRSFLLYDRYDIWKASPEASSPLVNLTVNGRKEKLSYRLVQLDPEERWINESESYLLEAFNDTTKGNGYYSSKLAKPAAPKSLTAGNFKVSNIIKAKEANTVVYQKETFEQYPELYTANLSFNKPVKITDEGKQQQEFLWGTAELISWTSLDGIPLQGVLCKPADFNPQKKYPLIVNFYDRSSHTLYNYHMPEPHRSTVDYHLYTSNGYIVFNPDVRYKDGYPGESCFNCVMPGISKLINEGYIDEKAIAAQGHSWGGYQVAYLATRTNLFAAIESGAPVVNMFSAYGGIRWGTGKNRSFQYEHGQSRIGGSPWEVPSRYIENSPLFHMDKVQTPILIMHNDNDGHVPWYQGIEYFIALKRLQKPAWLLNYTGEIHWPGSIPNRLDFQKRMFQFFNHYLKKEPMPIWMKEGIPAIDQEHELGYQQ